MVPGSAPMREALATVAPGQPLREGLDRILQAKRGALIVVGDQSDVLAICSGGFLLDAEFSPQRLSELAKMDGATLLAPDAGRISRANVHLVPDPSVPTSETGTRHRTAERVARTIEVPVISVSEDMAMITVYRHDQKRRLQAVPHMVDRAYQALRTLERYRARLDEVVAGLSALEVEDLVTVRDVATVLQRGEMVRRIAEEMDGYLLELGEDGRMLALQLDELMGGVSDDRRLVVRDYLDGRRTRGLDLAMSSFAELSTEELVDLKAVAAVLQLPMRDGQLDASVEPRGYRLLTRVPRLPAPVIERIVERFSNLQRTLRASLEDLDQVDGVGTSRARSIKDALDRLAESSILDRYS